MESYVLRAGVLTVSDRSSQNLRVDASGPAVAEFLQSRGIQVQKTGVVPDEADMIADMLRQWADSGYLDIVVTTGGTGLAPRDVTPEATMSVTDRLVPGMAETMRAYSLLKTPNAMLSRAVVGIRKCCLIINLPGSPKAAIENLEAIMPALHHALDKIKGDPSECGTLA